MPQSKGTTNQEVIREIEEVIRERVGQDKVQRVTKNQLQDHQTPAGSSATAHRGGHRHQAIQTNPQPPTGDARYGLPSLIFFLLFFPHSSLDSFPFTCTSSLSWHSSARSTLLSSSHYPWSYTCTSSALSLAQFFLTILAQFPPILFQHQSHSCTSYKCRTHTTLSSNLLFLSWLLTDDGVEHRNVLKSNYQLLPPDLSYHQ